MSNQQQLRQKEYYIHVAKDFRTLAAKPEALIVLTLLATLSLRLSSK